MKLPLIASLLALTAGEAIAAGHADVITVGPRPYALIDRMEDGDLKDKLLSCAAGPFQRTHFSIGHRGAPMQFPEHTVESNLAAARMAAFWNATSLLPKTKNWSAATRKTTSTRQRTFSPVLWRQPA